jgi:hypothetical protein
VKLSRTVRASECPTVVDAANDGGWTPGLTTVKCGDEEWILAEIGVGSEDGIWWKVDYEFEKARKPNLIGAFITDTTGATWEQPSDEEVREAGFRKRQMAANIAERFRMRHEVKPGWFEKLLGRLFR